MNIEQEKIEKFLKDLYPIMRSLTGNGNRKTLNYIKDNYIPDSIIKSIKSGTKIFDWEVPDEWNIDEAYIKNIYGKKIIDLKDNNLHIVSYSKSIDTKLEPKELIKKLHTLPNHPNWIPYRTTYYKKDWGFCCKDSLLKSKDFKGPFTVKIDSDFNPKGRLDWLECYHQGQSKNEILISTYFCHPNLANDNLSGLVAAVKLFEFISQIKTKFSYRLIIVPETIGAISFLSQANISRLVGGMVISCVAGPGKLSIKEGFDNKHWINKAAIYALEKITKGDYIRYPFTPDGSDERQYSSPGIRIVTPSIHKSKYYEYPEYHTSADDLNFISSTNLLDTLEVYKQWIINIESYCKPKRIEEKCELQLGKRGLYPSIGGTLGQVANNLVNNDLIYKENNFKNNTNIKDKYINAYRWIMHLADGTNSNFEICEKSNIDLDIINNCISIFAENKLVFIK